jgi:hypothetical protein
VIALGQFAQAEAILRTLDPNAQWVRDERSWLLASQGRVNEAWDISKDLPEPVLWAALLTRDPAKVQFALDAWPIEQRRPESFPEFYEAKRAEAMLMFGHRAEAQAILRPVVARLRASSNPYPLGWSFSPTPAFIPALLGDAADVRAAEQDYIANAPRDEFEKQSVWYELATDFLRVGDPDRAMHYLEGLVELFGTGQYPLISIDPVFDGLRSNPRYRALAERCQRSR